MSTLAYLGPTGTFSEQVALGIQADLPDPITPLPFPSIMATVAAVASGEVTWGIVPVENSLEGGVAATLDGCWQTEGISIHRAYILPIRYALVSRATQASQIQRVYSHPQALGQCRTWIESHLPQATPIPSSSTTAELEQIRDPQVGVICSIRAAEMLQMPVLTWISGQDHNQTRFWLLNRTPSPGGSLTSLALSLPANVPGALLKPLHIFAERQLNLSRIESRPTKQSAGTYVFFLDVEHPGQGSLAPQVLADLRAVTETLKILGSYGVRVLDGRQPHDPR